MRLLLVLSLAMALCSMSLSPVAAKRVRVKRVIISKGSKGSPLVTDLSYPLDELWDCLAQVDVPLLLYSHWQIMGMLGVACIIFSISRNAQKPQGQASNQEQPLRAGQAHQAVQGRKGAAPRSVRTDRRAKRTFSRAQLYKMMRAETMLLLRTTKSVHRLYLQDLRHEYYRRKAAERFQKSTTFSSSPGPSPS